MSARELGAKGETTEFPPVIVPYLPEDILLRNSIREPLVISMGVSVEGSVRHQPFPTCRPARHASNTSSTRSRVCALASYRSWPVSSSSSYLVKSCRTAAATASRIAPGSKRFAAADRPTRPLHLRQSCSAMVRASSGGHPGKSSRILAAKASTYSRSSSA